MILTQTIHCQPRAPLVVRGRTLAHGCCLPHTRTTPYHTSSFTSPVQGRPATTNHHEPASLRPASLTTAHHPSACPSLCFTLRCAVNSNNTRRCYTGVEIAHRLCGRLKNSIPESFAGKSTLGSLHSVAAGADKSIFSQRQLRSRLTSEHHLAGACPPSVEAHDKTLLIFLSFAPSSRSSLDLIIGKSAKLHVVSRMALSSLETR